MQEAWGGGMGVRQEILQGMQSKDSCLEGGRKPLRNLARDY
jgi:hypothetical protein